MKKLISGATIAAAAMFVSVAPASAADTITYNSAPNDPWSYGSGNNYSPSNTAVLTTDGGQQLYLRAHKYQAVAPASSVSGVYSFALDPGAIYNFDWGIDLNRGGLSPFMFSNPSGITALLTLTNIGTGQTLSFNPFTYAFDDAIVGGSVQNSRRFNSVAAALGFNPGVDSTYRVDLAATGLDGGSDSHALSIFAKFGAGAAVAPAVPEPATWALLLLGFGAIGWTMRNRRTLGAALPQAA